MIEAMNRFLTRGLRNAHSRSDGDWRELMTRAILGEWPAPAASPQTIEAERGLGILDNPYYFYVLRVEDSYGLVIFVLSQVEGVVWPENARGATPFDSGGWWLGKIRTEPPLDTAARQAAFRTLDVPLRDWQDAFEQYIHARYGTVGDYIKGRSPRSGNQPLETGFTIIKGQPNTARAWTWEVRVPYDLVAGRLTLKKAHMTEVSRDNYVDWLWRGPLPDSESLRIHRWILDHVTMPKQGESVVQSATESMALETVDG